MSKRIHVIQHVDYEGLGKLEPILAEQGATLTFTQAWDKPTYPAIDSFDALIVLGGPMSVHDEKKLPWLSAEKDFLAEAIDSGKPALGICLGAQLFAELLGGEVTVNEHPEMGWFPIEWKDSPELSLTNQEEKVFHWHKDTFSLPEGATLLASSKACKNQAFLYGSILGLQFHLETELTWISALLKKSKAELKTTGTYVQTSEEMLQESSSNAPKLKALVSELLSTQRLSLCEA